MKTDLPLARIRDRLIGEKGRFVFESRRQVQLPYVSKIDAYIHIPFCRSLCPYCPYNRVRYDKRQSDAYLDAVLSEIDAYGDVLGRIDLGSVYIGGGTPTTMLDDLGLILEKLKRKFRVTGAIAVETIPSDLESRALQQLKDIGVSLLSVGVQSFDDHYLKLIGRNYRSNILPPVLDRVNSAGFESVNIDMMFALPGQTTDQVLTDMRTAIALGAEQLTLYPLFTFPGSAIGRRKALRDVRLPPFLVRRRMYKAIHDEASAQGFQRVSVWGFKRDEIEHFSSVTRNHYIGIGAGAASRLPGLFYFNTFSVPHYTKTCTRNELPIALVMQTTAMIESYYWLYWRLYETRVTKQSLFRQFHDDPNIRRMLRLALGLRLLVDTGETFELTERGAFWIHLLQNYYVLSYINEVWTAAMQDPWPARIRL